MENDLKLSDVLSRDELRQLQEKSNIRALSRLAGTWALIAAAFAIAINWPNPFTILAGTLVLAGRQLSLGVINHDCAHHAFFKSEAVNHVVGHWLAGAPVNISLPAYRAYHLQHHKFAGTPDDPDIGFVKSYPVAPQSLKRKFTRDLTGRTGIRDMMVRLKNFDIGENYPWLSFHVVLILTLTLCGAPWAYAMWWAAELFILPAIVRLRQIGEHGAALDRSSQDPRLNTGTTLAPWWQKMFIAPNDVNYHVEHHYFASVPPYNLRRAHDLLSARGFYDGYDCIARGYGDVLRRAMRAP